MKKIIGYLENGKIKQFLIFLLLLPFFRPGSVSQIPIISKIYTVCRLLAIGIVLFLLLYHKERFDNSRLKVLFFLGVYSIFTIINTIVKSGDIRLYIQNSIVLVGFVVLLYYLMYRNYEDTTKCLTIILMILMLINMYTIIYYPNGLYNQENYLLTERCYYFLGHQNLTSSYGIIGLIIGLLDIYTVKDFKYQGWALVIISILAVIMCKAMSGLVGILLFILLALCYKIDWIKKLFSLRNIFIVSFVLFFAIVIFRFQYLFSFLIEDIMHKDLTFTGRTLLWDYAISYIKQSPLTGVGFHKIFVTYESLVFENCHNKFLFIIYQSGIIGLALYLLVIRQIICIIDSAQNTKCKYFILVGIFTIMVQFTFDTYSLLILYIPFVLCCLIEVIQKHEELIASS